MARRSVVVVGGGHGCSRSLAALSGLDVDRIAIVTVADDGGSSGRIRRDHGVVALGDLRMATLALAAVAGGTEGQMARLSGRRFGRGELAGHSLGNLLLLGLLEEHDGDLMAALATFADITGAQGTVLPATTTPVTLTASTLDGTVSGQAAVATTRRIRAVRLEPQCPPPAPGVLAALEGADLVLLGPGSLYTSVLPVLLVDGVVDALRRGGAPVVLVGNLREQPGETEGMDLADHVDALLQHLPDLPLDVILAHEPTGGRRVTRTPLPIDAARLAAHPGKLRRADLGDELDGHDPERLAEAVARELPSSPSVARHAS